MSKDLNEDLAQQKCFSPKAWKMPRRSCRALARTCFFLKVNNYVYNLILIFYGRLPPLPPQKKRHPKDPKCPLSPLWFALFMEDFSRFCQPRIYREALEKKSDRRQRRRDRMISSEMLRSTFLKCGSQVHLLILKWLFYVGRTCVEPCGSVPDHFLTTQTVHWNIGTSGSKPKPLSRLDSLGLPGRRMQLPANLGA